MNSHFTPEKVKALLPILQAFADGKTIQTNWGCYAGGDWQDNRAPDFGLAPEDYRVKPAPPREFWVVQSSSSERTLVHETKTNAEFDALCRSGSAKIVHVREVA